MSQAETSSSHDDGRADSDERIPGAVRAFTEEQLRVGAERTREELRQEFRLKYENHKALSRMRVAGLVTGGVIVVIVVGILGAATAKAWVRHFVEQKMDNPLMQEAANELLNKTFKAYRDEHLMELDASFKHFESSLNSYDRFLDRLREDQSLLGVATRAQGYDLTAFRELQTMATEGGARGQHAARIVQNVIKNLQDDRATTAFTRMTESKDDYIYAGPFAPDEVALQLQEGGKEAAANMARENGLVLLVPTLVTSLYGLNDMWSANRICLAISDLTGQDALPWDLDPFMAWWDENKSQYNGWPYDLYDNALVSYSVTQYEAALKQFLEVLARDPEADMCRAYAISSATELGQLEKATELHQAFKDPRSRWAKWANAKMSLASGPVDQATRLYAEIADEFPTFAQARIKPGFHTLRQVDWDLYASLTGKGSAQAASAR